MFSPADVEKSREPLVCPECQSVGYFKKRKLHGSFYYSSQRSWANAQDALEVVVLTGKEETTLCPRCLKKRVKGGRYIEDLHGEQPDMFKSKKRSPDCDPAEGPTQDPRHVSPS